MMLNSLCCSIWHWLTDWVTIISRLQPNFRLALWLWFSLLLLTELVIITVIMVLLSHTQTHMKGSVNHEATLCSPILHFPPDSVPVSRPCQAHIILPWILRLLVLLTKPSFSTILIQCDNVHLKAGFTFDLDIATRDGDVSNSIYLSSIKFQLLLHNIRYLKIFHFKTFCSLHTHRLRRNAQQEVPKGLGSHSICCEKQREQISCRTFFSPCVIKNYILNYIAPKVHQPIRKCPVWKITSVPLHFISVNDCLANNCEFTVPSITHVRALGYTSSNKSVL